MKKRKVLNIHQVRAISSYFQETHDMNAGICALVDVENMGWCKDNCTRWYTFTNDYTGEECIYFKVGDRPKYN